MKSVKDEISELVRKYVQSSETDSFEQELLIVVKKARLINYVTCQKTFTVKNLNRIQESEGCNIEDAIVRQIESENIYLYPIKAKEADNG